MEVLCPRWLLSRLKRTLTPTFDITIHRCYTEHLTTPNGLVDANFYLIYILAIGFILAKGFKLARKLGLLGGCTSVDPPGGPRGTCLPSFNGILLAQPPMLNSAHMRPRHKSRGSRQRGLTESTTSAAQNDEARCSTMSSPTNKAQICSGALANN